MLSIDVGIKNLSFCLFELQTSDNIKIIKWDNINLGEKNESKCIEIDKKGLCNKPAKFVKDDKCYCLKHSKKQKWIQPCADLKSTYLAKQKIQSLIEIANKYKIKYEDNQCKKIHLLTQIKTFIDNNCFTPVQKINATKVDLVTIGRNLQHKFDEILCDHLSSIEIIVIENQIGPLANKMKTVQGQISQYFIMKNNNIQIEIISASNKLKDYLPKNAVNNTSVKLDYKQRKKLGVQTCLEIMNNDSRFKEWEPFFNKYRKKDDLSDCFLQGMWFIKYKI